MARRVWLGTIAGLVVAGTVAFAVCGTKEPRHGVALTYRPTGDLALSVEIERQRIDRLAWVHEAGVFQRDDRMQIEAVVDDIAALQAVVERVGSLELKKVDTDDAITRLQVERVRAQRPRGIEAHEVPIHPAEGPPSVDLYVSASTRSDLTSYLARNDLGVPGDRELRYGKTRDGRWRTYLLEKQPWVTAAGITKARPLEEPNMPGRWQVRVDLDATSGERFGELTAANIGSKLAIVLDGDVVSDPIIQSAIRGGQVSITLGGEIAPDAQQREATSLADSLGTGALPGPLRLESQRDFEVAVDGVRWNVLAVLGIAMVAAALFLVGRRWRA